MSKMADWIRRQMDKGYSPRQIKEELVEEGYSLSTINSAFRELDLTSARNNKKEEDDQDEEGFEIPEEITIRSAGAAFLLITFLAISGVMFLDNSVEAASASENLRGVSQDGVQNHSTFFEQNKDALIQADRDLTTKLRITVVGPLIPDSTFNTTTKIEEGGSQLIINSVAQGPNTQDFEETRYTSGQKVWNRRINREGERSEEMYSTGEKGQALDGINYAGSAFSYIRIGDYDELETEGSMYVLKADSILPPSSQIINYSSELKINSKGMITKGKTTAIVQEDSMRTVRRLNYSAETAEIDIRRPDWVN